MRRTLLSILLLIPIAAWANENPRRYPEDRDRLYRHYILQTERVLRPAEQAELAASGVEIQHVLPDNRYLIRAVDTTALESDLRVRAVTSYNTVRKIASAAVREVTRGRAFARLNMVFHEDVSFEDAQKALEKVGGFVDRPLATNFDFPHRLTARVPSTALERLANDERVFGIYGPPMRPVALNSDAAVLSHVTPLYEAPYNLTGQGVVLSLFELAPADANHPEFQGRLTNHFTGGGGSNATHATHVAGTIIAAGIVPQAKGMAPAATLHEYNANDDAAIFFNHKEQSLPPLSVVADNNSWGFPLGWQSDGSVVGGEVWYGYMEYFGGYDGFYSTPYDKIARNGPVLFVHSAGNDGFSGTPDLDATNWSRHAHADDTGSIIKNETFCYSRDGSGNDCPAPTCTTGRSHCETEAHPTYGSFSTIGFIASIKNDVAVGAVDTFGNIATFSSRGPTRDGRVKPDLVAMGVRQFSTTPNGGYSSSLSGTSMSAPVVTGIAGLLTEQWKRTFNGQNPTPQVLKTLLIAGADDIGNPGPDYTFGFGLVNAKASVDLIRADGGSGSRIRSAAVGQGQEIETTFGINTAQNVRLVLGWADPEVLLSPDDLADKTLVNDVDFKVIDPSGAAVLPYILNKSTPQANAARGVNTADNVEEIEIRNAAPGTYRVFVTGTNIAEGASQQYVLAANVPLGTSAVCQDIYEPNDSEATAYGLLPSGIAVTAKNCSSTDADFFKIRVSSPGPLSIVIAATDTPIRVTLSGGGITPVVANITAGASGTVGTQVVTGPSDYIVKVEPTGTLGADARYTLTPTFNFVIPPRKRSSRH